MAEVRVIDNGTFNVEPQGPDWQGATPDCVPMPDPPIPFDKFRTFFAPYKNGEIGPFVLQKDEGTPGATTQILPAVDGGTLIRANLPAPFDSTGLILASRPIVKPIEDSFKICLKLKTDSPAPLPGEDFFILTGIGDPFPTSPDIVVFAYSQGLGQFALFIQSGVLNTGILLAPYVQGDEYEFEATCKPLLPSGMCFNVKAKQNDVVLVDSDFTFAADMRFLLQPILEVRGQSAAVPVSFQAIFREFSVGYQPLVDKGTSCP